MNPLDVTVSYYPENVKFIKSTSTLNLYEYLTNPPPEHIAKVQEVRACKDPKKQNELKKSVGGITPSGIFAPTRTDENLITHSGIITLDVDSDKNPDINFKEFRNNVQSIEWVAACMTSVRGTGLAIYVPIDQPEKHREHFESLLLEFSEMGIKLDPSCINLSRLRFNSYDPEIYINPNAKRYINQHTKHITPTKKAHKSKDGINVTDVFSMATELVEKQGVLFEDGSKHDYITRLSFILNEFGVPEEDTWEYVSNKYIPRAEIHTNCISGPYRLKAHEHATRTFSLTKKSARGNTKKQFPKRAKNQNTTTMVYTPHTETEWQEVPDFEWERPQPITNEPKPKGTPPTTAVQPLVEVKPFEKLEPPPPESWEQDITELENYFANITLPTLPVNLNKWSTITNCLLFIDSHFANVKANNGKRVFLPYVDRLIELKAKLTGNSQ